MDDAGSPPRISMFDNVRVRATPQTVAVGLAGLQGQVYGLTTPSVTGVEVIGELKANFALNVWFSERREDHWFAEELLEFLDHAPGTETHVAGARTKSVRTASGRWVQQPVNAGARNPWWKFWRRG